MLVFQEPKTAILGAQFLFLRHALRLSSSRRHAKRKSGSCWDRRIRIMGSLFVKRTGSQLIRGISSGTSTGCSGKPDFPASASTMHAIRLPH